MTHPLRDRAAMTMAASLIVITSFGCAAVRSGSFVDRNVSFSQYRTWEWGPIEQTPTGDPRLDSNPMFEEHLREAVEHQLSRKGYVRTTLAGTPDLRAHYHVNFDRTFEVTGGQSTAGSCSGNCGPDAYDYEQGSVVIDLVDAKTNTVVWRGWSRDNMEGVVDNQRRLEQEIDHAVAALFERCPSAP